MNTLERKVAKKLLETALAEPGQAHLITSYESLTRAVKIREEAAEHRANALYQMKQIEVLCEKK